MFDSLYDMEFDIKALGLAFAFWAFVMLMIWKFQFEGIAWNMKQQIIISIVSLPAFYFVIQWQLNRGG